MARRLEIGLKPRLNDPAGGGLAHKAKAYLGLALERVRVLRVLTFDTHLSDAELERVRGEIFTNPVTEISSFAPLADQVLPGFDWALWVGYKPGVKDNEGATAIEAMADALGRSFGEDEAVYSSRLFLIEAPKLNQEGAERICRRLLANDLIQTWRVIPAKDWNPAQGIGVVIPRVELAHQPSVKSLAIGSDPELLTLSAERDLFLNPADVPVIRAYFNDPAVRAQRQSVGMGDPTDVELEYVSQARSDHCNHNTFGGRFIYQDLVSGEKKVVANLFKETIKEPTEKLAAAKDWVVSVLWDNAGVAKLDDEFNYVITGETHNSPSNMEAYGGAITGIVGVYRDPMGTGKGSKLVAGLWGYCVAPRDYDGELTPALHPRRLLDGIIEGVRDGGNKSGIPTASGLLHFDPRYLGKCLVFVSAVGVIPATINGEPTEQKTTKPGQLVIMCGGRVGADGIHGVTASSAGYSENTPAGHVQIGDPYTQKKMHDFLLEARDAGLVPYLTDNGGGGLSSSVGESARFSPGAVVDLKQVPLKYEGLDPWQIWVSESQERMTVAVEPEDEAAFMDLADKHQVEATVIGRFTGDGKLRLDYGEDVCCYVDVEFLEEGFPQWEFEALWTPPEARGLSEPVISPPQDFGGLVLDLLDSPNLCSREWINRQYDHEVQGTSLLKPFCGRDQDAPAEASVILPVLTSKVGLAMAQVIAPDYGTIDTKAMVQASIDEAYRRLVAVGGDPEQVGGVDNFCWPSIQYHPVTNPDGRYKAAQLVRACWGLKEACEALEIPLLSGKDSMYVDGTLAARYGSSQRVSGPCTMMFTATAPVPDLTALQSLEPKVAGDYVYCLGVTKNELGGSALYGLWDQVGLNVPLVDLKATKALGAGLHQALKEGMVASSAVVSRGGLALCLARMVLASRLGLEVDLDCLEVGGQVSAMQRLFSESTGRMLVTVPSKRCNEFEDMLEGVPWARMGRVVRGGELTVGYNGQRVLALKGDQMRRAWRRRFGRMV
ncbi:MAG: phosphoribosylformylglycinamidine synthase [Desulfarculaceae bacterium]|nr:phosphoribosylformylglycinamidine synthase [Desulfarculaceae bacterium]